MSGSIILPPRLRPRTLRDLLNENSISCSSNGFKSFPRNPTPSTTMRSLMEMDIQSSSRNSNPRILNSLLTAFVKRLSSFTVKSPSILRRSLSRRLSRKNNSSRNYRESAEIKVPVRIKDIVRWKSFRDLEEQPDPLDFSAASTSSSSSKGSSWSESDFSSCDGNFRECCRNDVGEGKGFFPLAVGKDSVYATTGNSVGPKGDLTSQEEEPKSPVSVLRIEEDELPSFDQSLVDIHDHDDTGGDEEHERIEKMARKSLRWFKASGSIQWSKAHLDELLLDFFKDELKKRRNDQTRNHNNNNDDDDNNDNDKEFAWEIMRIAQEYWMNSSDGNDLEKSDKDACIRDMDKRDRWSKFEEEKEELAWEIQSSILDNLIVEIFNGSFSYSK